MTGSRFVGARLLVALLIGVPALAHAKGPQVPGDAAAIVPKIGQNAAIGLAPAPNVTAPGLRPVAATPAAIGRADAATPSLSGSRRVDNPGIGLKHDKLTRDSVAVVEVATDKTPGRSTAKSEESARGEPTQSAAASASPSNATAAAQTERVLPTCR